jgi:hypothetical protein
MTAGESMWLAGSVNPSARDGSDNGVESNSACLFSCCSPALTGCRTASISIQALSLTRHWRKPSNATSAESILAIFPRVTFDVIRLGGIDCCVDAGFDVVVFLTVGSMPELPVAGWATERYWE